MKKSPLPIKEILKYSLILLLVIAVFSVLSRKWGGKKGTLLDYEQARQESLSTGETPSAENDSADGSASQKDETDDLSDAGAQTDESKIIPERPYRPPMGRQLPPCIITALLPRSVLLIRKVFTTNHSQTT